MRLSDWGLRAVSCRRVCSEAHSTQAVRLDAHPCSNVQVRQVAEEAIARARRGEGPTLIEAETYRFRGHSLADPDELRTKEEKDYYLVSLLLRPG